MLVADIYNTNISPINEELTIHEALKFLIDKAYNGVLVTNNKGKLTGILSMQDIAGAIIPPDMKEHATLAGAMYKPNFFKELSGSIKKKKVSEIMRKTFITATPETPVIEIVSDFLQNDLYIVPVIENDEIIGIITRSEIKKALIKGMDTE